jgi:preprotein translocase subunit SecD
VEGNYLLRLGAIAMMVLGSIYVLLPSYLDDRTIDAGSYGNASSVNEPALEVWIEPADGEADKGNAAVVESRLRAFGATIDRVEATDTRYIVHLLTGQARPPVVEVATAPGVSSVHGPEAVGIDPAALATAPDADAAIAAVMASASLTPAAPALPSKVVSASRAEGALSVVLDPPPTVVPFVVAVDGRIVGYALAPAAPGEAVVLNPVAGSGTPGADAAVLVGGTLTESLQGYVAPAIEEQVDKPVEVEEVGGWRSLLPNTKLNLGLDLQGGIDLTLQVDQDAAVFSQVQRDRNILRDQALKDGMEMEVLRSRSRPALQIAYADDRSKLTTYLETHLPQYGYVETVEEDGKTLHVYQIGEAEELAIKEQAVEQVLETLRNRVDSTGVREPSIVKMPGGRINIQLPGVKNSEQAIDAIGTQAILEFRLVDEQADESSVARMVAEAQQVLPADQAADAELLTEWLHRQGKLPQDRVIRFLREDEEAEVGLPPIPYQLHEQVMLTGGDVNTASVTWDQANQPQVILSFKAAGSRIFCDVTTAHVRERFAIMLDGVIRSAPKINEPICGGSASIQMGGTANGTEDANTLALVLRTGSLTAPVETGQVREIGPSLGADSIRAGVYGSLIGGAITLLFMAVWYRWAGLAANIALMLNVLLVFAMLALVGATLTLPGIAGVALTIGMAVDANIIIFERIREELKLGVVARKAVEAGFSKGVVAVLDGNITTAIAGVVLYSYGTGPIKGFAVTLLLGIATTLVTALFVTRTFMDLLTRNSNVRLRL